MAKYSCTGEVKGLAIDPQDGRVHVEKLADLVWPVLCSTVSDQNGIPVENCKVIYSTLLAAQLSNKKVTLWFNDGHSCTSGKTSWTWLKGWYFGPKISG
ncbi:hypothetical protein SOPP22_01425 [Shewanella sp. OPT22]|nr:hypothetical protein SOPP22_01425 [Shewanella sp. OPT22]